MDKEERAAKQTVLRAHRRRQAKLEEQRALLGYSRDPKIDLELEDIAAALLELQDELNTTLAAPVSRSHAITRPKSWLYIGICAFFPVNVCMALFGPLAGGIIGLLIGMVIGMVYAVVFPDAVTD